ncbi:MAG: c-type cytochrome [Saprospiraceae bacterium]
MDNTFAIALSVLLIALAIGVALTSVAIGRFRQVGRPSIEKYWLQALERILQGLALLLIVGVIFHWLNNGQARQARWAELRAKAIEKYDAQADWQIPDAQTLELDPHRNLIEYGRDLIAHTTDYFGEYGLVRPNSINQLNCQNCHLEAGAKAFGNNYAAVVSTYPKVRARSGQVEDIRFRINDCFMRSLNGQALDTASREMKAIVAYIEWLGSNVPPKLSPKGVGLVKVPYLDRAADPALGAQVYSGKCASCHGADGQGLPMPGTAREYPPLWGEHSYSEAAGLFRLSRFAGYVKANMPFGSNYHNPQLSDEEAWDVAAYVNSQARPKHPFLDIDWPDISKKPFDHPFGPFADTFPEKQHKYGPFGPIVAYYQK